MPIYEYQCQKCEHITETLRSMSQADDAIECEECGSKKTKRAHSVPAATTGGQADTFAPPSGCGRCGDPNGACPFN